jgi:lipopolysaccharide heptosyltransferase II
VIPRLGSVRSALVIKPRAAGDVVLATPVVRNLRLALPEVPVDVLTERPFADLVRGNPDVRDVVVHDRPRMSGLDLIRAVRSRGYDLVIDLFCNPRTALVTFLSGARIRVGYRFRGRSYAYTLVVEPRGASVHNVQFNLDALEALGLPAPHRSPVVPSTAADAASVERFFAASPPSSGPVVAVNAAGGWYTKRWGSSRFAQLCDRLIAEHGCTVVLTWGPGERDLVESIRAAMRETPLIPPATTFPQLAALLARCDFAVSNDTGPMHIAAAVGTPVLGIYGPTNPALQGPYGEGHVTVRNEALSCLGCNLTSCPIGHPCMEQLDIETVLEAFVRLRSASTRP